MSNFGVNKGGVGKYHVFLPVTRHVSETVQDTITVISWLSSLCFSLSADPNITNLHQRKHP